MIDDPSPSGFASFSALCEPTIWNATHPLRVGPILWDGVRSYLKLRPNLGM